MFYRNLLTFCHFFLGGDAPILLLLFSAGPVNLSFVDWNPRVPAIMQCFFPAQATGKALFSTLVSYSKYYSPAGRLPYTWYATADQVNSEEIFEYMYLDLHWFPYVDMLSLKSHLYNLHLNFPIIFAFLEISLCFFIK